MRKIVELDFGHAGFSVLKASENLEILGYDSGKLLDVEKISQELLDLSTESPHANSILFDPITKWGRIAFRFQDRFVKAKYVSRHLDRAQPFIDASFKEAASNQIACIRCGIPAPRLDAIFSVRHEEGWLWNGIIMEFLEGYHESIGTSEEQISEIAKQMAENGICHNDFKPSNLMENNGVLKVIDFDNMTIGVDPDEAYKTMMENWSNPR